MTNEDHEKNLESEIDLNVNKLLLLIKNLSIPAEAKEAMIQLLPTFTLEQMDALLNVLEAKYLDEQTKEVDEKLKHDLLQIMDEFNSKDREEAEKLLNQLNVISKEI